MSFSFETGGRCRYKKFRAKMANSPKSQGAMQSSCIAPFAEHQGANLMRGCSLPFNFQGIDEIRSQEVIGLRLVLLNAPGITERSQRWVDGQLGQQG